ncbi:hypothetical protein BU202_02360 [Streptococcus cuniculi]|uniref:beta-N-acetylhexosaminidase n=1 Tax=Streptococcus cuniculi TaxID=1432788 RepID=A0A1Q8E9K8_9STRE|nr:glycoside hydrolase family 20 zincin-like fold domain-containing protein [Streptococcus cuniculi]OLF48479.1 hypothetical protein BU202_02360 [Streptococcus cuniculi]
MNILPFPQHIDVQEEKYYVLSYMDRIVIDPAFEHSVYACVRFLHADIEQYLGFDLQVTRSSDHAAIRLVKDESLPKQHYRLSISEKGIRIDGSSKEGLLYGIQTLRQIIAEYAVTLPYLIIEDYPAIQTRGYYLDVTRCRIPKISYLKSFIDKLAYYKINQFQLYIEHSFLFEGWSEVWRDDTPLTAKDILELDQYCIERNIELVPSIATFGHFYKVLRTKSFRHLCEMPDLVDDPFSFVDRQFHHTLDITNPDSFAFTISLIEEYLPLFTSNKFNICGDETFDLGKGKSKKMADKVGVNELYVQFVAKLCHYLVEKGKIPMFWGDIIVNAPENLKRLPKETICLSWGYEADQDDEAIQKVAATGAHQYCCPGVSGWDQLVPQIEVSYENIRRMCDYAIAYQAEGILNTDWGDCGHINHPDMSLPGLMIGAECSWNRTRRPFDQLNEVISRLEFRDTSGQLLSVINQMSKAWTYKWRDLVNYKEQVSELVEAEKIHDYLEALASIERIKQELARVVSHLETSSRYRVQPYFLALDGMALLQKIGISLLERYYQLPPHVEMSSVDLASSLEQWFYHYKVSWRKVSQESELYRVQEIIFWTADLLRSESIDQIS